MVAIFGRGLSFLGWKTKTLLSERVQGKQDKGAKTDNKPEKKMAKRDTVESTRIEPFLGENRVILD